MNDTRTALRLAPTDDRVCLNAARTYAILSGFVISGTATHGNTLTLERCQRQACEYIQRALGTVAANKRRAYWRDYIEKDPYFDRIRQHPDYDQLQTRVMRTQNLH
jgi:hypothetical protein